VTGSNEGFAAIPKAILRDPTLSCQAKLVYAEILSYAWTNSGCTRDQGGMAEELGMSVSSVKKGLSELAKRGLITIEVKVRAHGRGNVYRPRGVSNGDAATSIIDTTSATNGSVARQLMGEVSGNQEVKAVEVEEQGDATRPLFEIEGKRVTREAVAAACWAFPFTDEGWRPTYFGLYDYGMKCIREEGLPWRDPDPVRQVIDFWRDLHWHFDAADTPARVAAARTALEMYPLERTDLVFRAIAAAVTDRWIQDPDGNGPHDKLETIIAVTAARDNVDRLGHQVGEEELEEYLQRAELNRSCHEHWRSENFEFIEERWRFDNRRRLEKDSRGKFRRYLDWQAEAARSGVR
jgi:hypothetical protein